MPYKDPLKQRESDRLRQRKHRAKLKQGKGVTLIVESVIPSIVADVKTVADKSVTPAPETPKKRSALMDWVFSDID
jgi:hypothetical protein